MRWPQYQPVWPTGVIRPPGAPLVYLDLNHWIYLAGALLGRPKPGYADLLRACRSAKERGAARFVLSGSLVEEIWAIPNPRQRVELSEVIEMVSGFEYLAPLSDVMRLEVSAFLNVRTGTLGIDHGSIPLIGNSLLHIFGMVGGLRIHDEETGLDITDQLQADEPGFEERHRQLERVAERMLIQGPDDEMEIQLRAAGGYQPEVPRQKLLDNVTIEQAFADERLTQRWRKGRLADVLAARHLSLELLDTLTRELMHRGISVGDVAQSLTDFRELPLAMPSASVFVAMKGHYHRNATRRWSINDLHDIGAMSIAVPYCDVVFTDAEARAALQATGQDALLGTFLPRTPGELVAHLDGL